MTVAAGRRAPLRFSARRSRAAPGRPVRSRAFRYHCTLVSWFFRRLKLSHKVRWTETWDAVQQIVERDLRGKLSDEARSALLAVLRESSGKPASATAFVEKELTVLLADLRGFTSFSERYPARVVIETLNEFLIEMSAIVARNGGVVEKFMGDSVMAVFGLPEAREDDAVRAVTCGLEMQAGLDRLNERRDRSVRPALYMGIGISSGPALTGSLGSDLYAEHAVIGDDVNLASRIEAVSLRGQVLISDSTFRQCRRLVEAGEPVNLYVKGKARPVVVHDVLAMPSLGLKAQRHDMRASPRAQAMLPFTYHLVEDKVVMSEALDGIILDIGYQGVAIRVALEHPPHTELKLAIAMPLFGADVWDVYARVIRTRREGDFFVSGLAFTGISDEASAQVRRFVNYLLQSTPEFKVE